MKARAALFLLIVFILSVTPSLAQTSTPINDFTFDSAMSIKVPKLDSQLARLSVEYQTYLNAGGVQGNFQSSMNDILVGAGDRIRVDIAADGDTDALILRLQALGLEDATSYGRMISGSLPIGAVSALASVDALQLARIPQAGTHAGSVDSQANTAMNATIARTTYSVDGTGFIVGAMSDSYDCGRTLDDAADNVASGDLPVGVNVLDDTACSESDDDEGRAMLQLIHDVAPGAGLAFHTAFNGQADFAQGIQDLANAGSDVIVDDVYYYAEPFFQDGIIAQAVDSVVASGIPYFAAGGNQATDSYEAAFDNSGINDSFKGTSVTLHDFDPGPGVDTHMRITLFHGYAVRLAFQWDDPFFAVSGAPGADTDMDIFLLNTSGQVKASSTTNNIGGDPFEYLYFQNTTGSLASYDIVIGLHAGPAPTLMKFIDFDGNATYTEFATNSPTTMGHANSATGMSVGAAFYQDTPAYGTTPPVKETFTSLGGIQILFDTSGTRYGTPVTRMQPRVTAPDGTNTTFFIPGRDPELDGFYNFYGTSAAAPVAAAVAALLLDYDSLLTPNQVYSALETTAIDMETAGHDYYTGYGLIQADAAIASVAGGGGDATISGTVTDVDLVAQTNVDVLVYESGTANLLTSTCTDGSGDYSVTTSFVGTVDVKAGGIDIGSSICGTDTTQFNQTSVAQAVAASGSYTVDLTLTNVRISGTVTDVDLVAQNNVDVLVYEAGTINLLTSTCTDVSGNYNVTTTYSGDVDIKAGGIDIGSSICGTDTTEFNQTTETRTVSTGTDYTVNLVLANVRISGTVTDIDLVAQNNVDVLVYEAGTVNLLTSTCTDGSGNYNVTTTYSGNVDIKAGGIDIGSSICGTDTTEFNQTTETRNVITGTDYTVNLVLANVRISGTVTDSGATPQVNVDVLVYESGTSNLLTSTCTDGAGNYNVTTTYSGNIDIKAGGIDIGSSICGTDTTQFNQTTETRNVITGTDYIVDIVLTLLSSDKTISGLVQDASGGNMEFIEVRFFQGGTSTSLGTVCTDGSGAYSFMTTYSGNVDVKAGNKAAGSCTYPTIEYDEPTSTVDTSTGSNFVANLVLTPDQAPYLAPSLSTPTGVQTTQTPTFTWNRIVNATAYQIQVSGDVSPVFNVTSDVACGGSSTCSYTPTGGEALPYALTTYNASVRAANSLGNGPWGGATFFAISPSINTPSGVATLQAPAEASINGLTPTLEWTPVSGASHYDIYAVYLAYSEYITVAAADVGCSPTCSYVLNAPEGYMGYRIYPKNYNGPSGWSSARYFFTTSATGVATPPLLTSPTTTVSTTTTAVTWDFELGVNRYSIYTIQPSIYGSTFTYIDAQALCPGYPNATTCSFNLNTPWSGTYNVQINARNPFGWSGYGVSPVTVNLAGGSALSTPTWENSGGVTTATSIPLSWSAVDSALSYTLVVYDPRGISNAQVYNSTVCSLGTCTVIFDADVNGAYAAYVRANGVSAASEYALNQFTLRSLNTPSVGVPIVDSDGDGIDDSFDNCTIVANAEQLDRDGDGIGSACDLNDTPNQPTLGSNDDTQNNDPSRGLPGAPSSP